MIKQADAFPKQDGDEVQMDFILIPSLRLAASAGPRPLGKEASLRAGKAETAP